MIPKISEKDFRHLYKRYINNNILTSCPRPQRKNECSVTAMATVVNALWGTSYMGKDIIPIIKRDESDIRNFANQSVIEGFKEIFKQHGWNGDVGIYLKGGKLTSENGTLPADQVKYVENLWFELKKEIHNDRTALIYHEDNHYTVICGYYEEPVNIEKFENYKNGFADRRDYVIIAEQSGYFGKEPIRIIPWLTIRKDLDANSNHLLIRIRRIN